MTLPGWIRYRYGVMACCLRCRVVLNGPTAIVSHKHKIK